MARSECLHYCLPRWNIHSYLDIIQTAPLLHKVTGKFCVSFGHGFSVVATYLRQRQSFEHRVFYSQPLQNRCVLKCPYLL